MLITTGILESTVGAAQIRSILYRLFFPRPLLRQLIASIIIIVVIIIIIIIVVVVVVGIIGSQRRKYHHHRKSSPPSDRHHHHHMEQVPYSGPNYALRPICMMCIMIIAHEYAHSAGSLQ